MSAPEHKVLLVVERDRAISALVSDANPTSCEHDIHRSDTVADAATSIGTLHPDVVVMDAELVFGSGVGAEGHRGRRHGEPRAGGGGHPPRRLRLLREAHADR